jgi:uncharacterized protein DUF6970
MNFWKRSIALVVLMIAGCGGNPAAPHTSPSSPAWVMALVRQLETEPVANPPGFVARYDYKEQDVYFVPQRCCDVMSVVYRSDGAVMCHPDGGFSGKGDAMCRDFFAERRNERIIWRDSKR